MKHPCKQYEETQKLAYQDKTVVYIPKSEEYVIYLSCSKPLIDVFS